MTPQGMYFIWPTHFELVANTYKSGHFTSNVLLLWIHGNSLPHGSNWLGPGSTALTTWRHTLQLDSGVPPLLPHRHLGLKRLILVLYQVWHQMQQELPLGPQ